MCRARHALRPWDRVPQVTSFKVVTMIGCLSNHGDLNDLQLTPGRKLLEIGVGDIH